MKQDLFLMQPTNPKMFWSKILNLGGSGVHNTSTISLD